VNGVISLNRPQCSEAAAGKNPVNHVGENLQPPNT
jgi:S-adenosylmethionine synthetase